MAFNLNSFLAILVIAFIIGVSFSPIGVIDGIRTYFDRLEMAKGGNYKPCRKCGKYGKRRDYISNSRSRSLYFCDDHAPESMNLMNSFFSSAFWHFVITIILVIIVPIFIFVTILFDPTDKYINFNPFKKKPKGLYSESNPVKVGITTFLIGELFYLFFS